MPNYIVIENTPGYLPDDDDPFVTDDLNAARVYASDLLSSLMDHLLFDEDDPNVLDISGSFQEDMSVYVTDKRRPHDLGRVISIELAEDDA